jgi:hypothetical protein
LIKLAARIGGAEWFFTALWLLLLAALLLPICLFLRRGWTHRRADILSSVSPRAAALYLRNFQATDEGERNSLETLLGGVNDWERARSQAAAAAELGEAESRLRELQTAAAAALPADLDARNAEVAQQEQVVARLRARLRVVGAPNPDQPMTPEAAEEAQKRFLKFYNARFGRRLYLGPVLLMLALAALMLAYTICLADHYGCGAHLTGEPAAPDAATPPTKLGQDWAWVVAFAVWGGYCRAVYELVLRYYQDNIRPADIFWVCYRLLISVPLGYAVAVLLAGGENARTAYAAAFLLGLFPTSTVTNLGRRWFAKWTNSEDTMDNQPSQLKEVPSLDPATMEILAEEGITTFTQLAYADPVRLTIRTGLGYSFIVTAVSEALLLGYLTTRGRMDVARKYGVAGAYEASSLWDDAQLPAGDPVRGQADRIIDKLSTELGTSNEGLRNILEQVAGDPYLQFVVECWASNFSTVTG